jgi:lysozyme
VTAQDKQLLTLLGLGGVGLWLWFTQSGQSAAASTGDFFSTNPQPPGALPIGPQDSTYRLIANFEQFSATPYQDAGGWSIGYGHFMGAIPTMQSILPEDAWNLLVTDTAKAARAVTEGVSVPLTQNQYDALVSLAYNIGNNAFLASTLLANLNAGDYAGAANQFPRWNLSQGKVLTALVDRRGLEKQLFLT